MLKLSKYNLVTDGYEYMRRVTLDDVAIPFIISIGDSENVVSG